MSYLHSYGLVRWPVRLHIYALGFYLVASSFFSFYLDWIFVNNFSLPWFLREGGKDALWLCLFPLFTPVLMKVRTHKIWVIYFAVFGLLIGVSLVLNPPLDARIGLAVIRNNLLYSFVPFLVCFEIGKSEESSIFERIVTNLALIQALIAIAQKVFHLSSPYLIATKPDVGSVDHLVSHGGFLSYIELSSFLCLALAYISTKPRVALSGTVAIILISIAVFFSTARLGALIVGLIFLARFGMRAFFWIVPLGLIVVAFSATNIRLLNEGLETPRTKIWTSLLSGGNPEVVKLEYGSYGSATSAANLTTESYVDSTLVSSYLQGGMLGAVLCILPFALLSMKILRVTYMPRFLCFFGSLRWKRMRPSDLRNSFVLVVLFLYSVVFNFMDGWPGNLLTWSFLGIIFGEYAQTQNSIRYNPYQKRGSFDRAFA